MLNKDFALIDDEGYCRYPYIVNVRGGYSCNPKRGKALADDKKYPSSIEEVITGVISQGWSVRVKRDVSELPAGIDEKEAGTRFQKKGFNRYWVSSAYLHLVKDFAFQPEDKHPMHRGVAADDASNGIDDVVPMGRLEAEAVIDNDPKCKGATPTEREAFINARIGQGRFRKGMLAIWGHKCALTGLSLESALVASHAKAWKHATNKERLDPYNGLLLAATVDKLFDCGLISFSDDGAMLLSSRVSTADLKAIGLSADARLSNRLHEEHKPFLRAHREQHGFEGSDAATA